MKPEAIKAAEKLLEDWNQSRSLPAHERVAWATVHAPQLVNCIDRLLVMHTGYRDGAQKNAEEIYTMALRLRDAIKPLFSKRTGFDPTIDGQAPRLRERYRLLDDFVEGAASAHPNQGERNAS